MQDAYKALTAAVEFPSFSSIGDSKIWKTNSINFYEVAQNHSLFFYLIIGYAVFIVLCVYIYPDNYLCNDHLDELRIHVFSKNLKDVVSAFVLRDGVEVAPLAARVLVEPVARVHALVHVASHQVSWKKIIIKFIVLLNAIFIKFPEKNESKAYILMNIVWVGFLLQLSFNTYIWISTFLMHWHVNLETISYGDS